MKVGDVVMHKVKHYGAGTRREWGVGYIIEVHRTMYKNHIPFVTVIWPKWNKETKGSQDYLEVISESR